MGLVPIPYSTIRTHKDGNRPNSGVLHCKPHSSVLWLREIASGIMRHSLVFYRLLHFFLLLYYSSNWLNTDCCVFLNASVTLSTCWTSFYLIIRNLQSVVMRGRLSLSELPSQKHLLLLQLFQSQGMSSLNIQFREVFANFLFSNMPINYFFFWNASQINQCLSDMEPLSNLMWCCLPRVWMSGILILSPVLIQTVISDLPNMQNHALLLLKTIVIDHCLLNADHIISCFLQSCQ